MAWARGIQNERQRQVVVAAIMAVLLALALAAAMWVSGDRWAVAEQAALEQMPALESTQVGDFTLLRPGGWEQSSPEIEPGDAEELTRWREPGGAGRRLAVLEMRHAEPLPPAVAMELVMRQGNNQPGRPSRAAVRSDMMIGVLAERPGVLEDGRQVAQLLAVMTLDGRRHAVLVLERLGEMTAADWRLMVQIAGSLADSRFRKIDPSTLSISGSGALQLPDGLSAVERLSEADAADEAAANADESDADEVANDEASAFSRLLLIPAEQPLFFLLEPRMVQLEAEQEQPSLAAVDRGDASDSPEAEEADGPPPLTASQRRLALTLARLYVQTTGEQPPPRSVSPMKVGGRDGFTVTLPDEGSGSRSALWAIEFGGGRVMLMRLIADPASATQARTAAERFIATFEPA